MIKLEEISFFFSNGDLVVLHNEYLKYIYFKFKYIFFNLKVTHVQKLQKWKFFFNEDINL